MWSKSSSSHSAPFSTFSECEEKVSSHRCSFNYIPTGGDDSISGLYNSEHTVPALIFPPFPFYRTFPNALPTRIMLGIEVGSRKWDEVKWLFWTTQEGLHYSNTVLLTSILKIERRIWVDFIAQTTKRGLKLGFPLSLFGCERKFLVMNETWRRDFPKVSNWKIERGEQEWKCAFLTLLCSNFYYKNNWQSEAEPELRILPTETLFISLNFFFQFKNKSESKECFIQFNGDV